MGTSGLSSEAEIARSLSSIVKLQGEKEYGIEQLVITRQVKISVSSLSLSVR